MTRQDELNEAWCKYMGKCSTELMQALAFALRWCDEHPHWISVEDELPEGVINKTISNIVLTFSADGYIRISRYMHYYHKWVNGASDVTHWMPLPAPPAKLSNVGRIGKEGL